MTTTAEMMVRLFDAIIRDDANLFFDSASTDHLLIDHIPMLPASGYFTNEFGWYVDNYITQLVIVVDDVPGARALAQRLCLENYIHFGAVGDSINLCSAAKIVSMMNDPLMLVEWKASSDASAGARTLTEFDVSLVHDAINLYASHRMSLNSDEWERAMVEMLSPPTVEGPSDLFQAEYGETMVKAIGEQSFSSTMECDVAA